MKKAVLCLLALACLLTLSSCGGAFRRSSVLEGEETALLLRDDKERDLSDAGGTRLADGDVIRTGAGGSAWLRLDEDKTLLLDENSELGISGGGTGFTLELTAGTLLVRIDRPLGTAETFDVVVGSTVLGVRGTVFSVEREASGRALLCVYQGRVAVADRSGSEAVTVEKGQSVRFVPDSGALDGEVGPIDFNALSDFLAGNVADYAREAMARGADETPTAPPDGAVPESEPPQESDFSDDPVGTPDGEVPPTIVPERPSLPPSGGTAAPPAAIRYTVVFDLDGGRIGSAGGRILAEVESGRGAVPPEGVVKDGSVFAGWVTERGGETPAELGKISGNLTVYAKWDTIDAPEPEFTPIPPKVTFSYRWDGAHFQPCADIAWVAGCESAYLLWQVFDGDGEALASSGRIEGVDGTVNERQTVLTLSHPSDTGLYPAGYLLRLTPYCSIDGKDTALAPVEMALPYLEADATEGGSPVLSTNIGLYFHHAYDSLTVIQEGETLRVTGRLLPLTGEAVPLEIDLAVRPTA